MSNENGSAPAPTASPQQEAAALPRWELRVSAGGEISITGNARDVTVSEVLHGALLALRRLENEPVNGRIPYAEDIKRARHAQIVLRDYPADRFFPSQNVVLCAACVDLYGDLIEGEPTPIPGGSKMPCSFHMDPERAPMPFAEAAHLKGQDTGAH